MLLAALAAPLCAQRHLHLPAGSETREGNFSNTIPFWSGSATYQQVHDDVELARLGAGPWTVVGLALRKDRDPANTTARSLEVTLSLNLTTVSSRTMTGDFAANLGPGATTVLPWTPVNLPALTNVSTPNPPALTIAFAQPFVLAPAPGRHLVWEWRHRRNSDTSFLILDAVDAETAVPHPNEGRGCRSPSQPSPATVVERSLRLTAGTTLRMKLDFAAPGAPAALLLGFQRGTLQVPGFCAPALLVPLMTLPGATDPGGRLDLIVTNGDLRGLAADVLLGQFLFLDPGIPPGAGLSDLAVLELPLPGASSTGRAYTSPQSAGQGFENSTMAQTVDRWRSLAVALRLP